MANIPSKISRLRKGGTECAALPAGAPLGSARGNADERTTPTTQSSSFRERNTFMKNIFGWSARRIDRPTTSASSSAGASANRKEDVQEYFREVIAEAPSTPGVYEDDAIQRLNDAKGAFNRVTRMNTTCIQVLKSFKTLADTLGGPLSSLNPIAQVAVRLLTQAAQTIIDQDARDGSVSALLPRIQGVYEFLMEKDTLQYIDTRAGILAQLAQVVNDCADFITKYSERESLVTRLGKHFLLDTQSHIDEFNQRLDALMQRYRDFALQATHVTVSYLSEDFKIEGMTCAVDVGLMKTKACLDGTRSEVLAEIMRWFEDPSVNAPRILWLHGQAGKGKSAIAHTIAMWFKNTGRLASCFCFARDRQAERLELKMFRTIARDMATYDPLLRRAVADAVAADNSLKATSDVTQQWEDLILGPVSRVSGGLVSKLVVIDALDESGLPASREHLLSIIGSKAASLPPNFRILLTSRPLVDIVQALANTAHVRAISLDDVPTSRDIHLYVSQKLATIEEIGDVEIMQIVEKSDGLFEWARLACEFIQPTTAGETAIERFEDLMKHGPENGRMLDSVYHAILESAIGKRSIALERFRSVMQQILCMLEPVPMEALNAMRSVFPAKGDRYKVEIILRYMGSLLSGVTNQVWDAERGMQVGSPFKGHTAGVTSVAFSPDGTRIVSGSYDSTVRVWDTNRVAFSPNGIRIVSGSDDTTIRVWDADRGVLIVSLLGGHTGVVTSVAFSPDGTKIVSASYDNTVRVWDADKGVQLYSPLEGHIGGVTSVAFSPDGTRIVSASYDNTVRLWDADRGVQVTSAFIGHTDFVTSVMFSPDSTRVVSGSCDKTVRVWDADRGVQITSLLQGHTLGVSSVAFSPDGTRIVSGSYDKTIRVWDAERVVFSPDGTRIASGSYDNSVRVWDVDRGVQISLLEGHSDCVTSVGVESSQGCAGCKPIGRTHS
ncbi:hypothetical protein ID866_6466 [Astraeus odoratus]|nr:hypothetical protein ID866_6466 [Astraeus odoratus]